MGVGWVRARMCMYIHVVEEQQQHMHTTRGNKKGCADDFFIMEQLVSVCCDRMVVQ